MSRRTDFIRDSISTIGLRCFSLGVVGFFVISGCHRNPSPEAPHVHSAPLDAVSLSQLDLGASLLAAVDNARFAILKRDSIAAANDVNEALSYASLLPDRPSNLLLTEPRAVDHGRSSGSAREHISLARLTDFGALVKLTSSRAQLDNGNLDGADAELRAIQDGIPQSVIPSDLPLLRAAASLDLGRLAASEGRTPDLKIQLLSAQLALSSYAGPAHLAEAKELAATISQTLAQSGPKAPILEYQVSAWLGKVVRLAGGGRWDPAPR